MSKFGTKIKVELVTHGCFPTKAYETDDAYDLHVSKDMEVAPYLAITFRSGSRFSFHPM